MRRCDAIDKSYLYSLLQKQLNSLQKSHTGLDIEGLAAYYLSSMNHRPGQKTSRRGRKGPGHLSPKAHIRTGSKSTSQLLLSNPDIFTPSQDGHSPSVVTEVGQLDQARVLLKSSGWQWLTNSFPWRSLRAALLGGEVEKSGL